MKKTIVITPQTMVGIVAGRATKPLDVPGLERARIVKAGFNPRMYEFWVEVESDSASWIDPNEKLPQEFRIDLQKI